MSEKTKQQSQLKHDQFALAKLIGQRLREARELCNMSQQAAAKQLGYSNSSKLAKVENAADTNSVPFWLIARAAKLYDVSTDFLMGVSDDWETGASNFECRESFGWLQNELQKTIAAQLEGVARLSRKMDAIAASMAEMNPLIDKLSRGVTRALSDRTFEEVPGGSTIVSSSEEISRQFSVVMAMFKRAKMDLQSAKREDQEQSTIGLVQELSRLDTLTYYRERIAAARMLGLPTKAIDKLVEQQKRATALSSSNFQMNLGFCEEGSGS